MADDDHIFTHQPLDQTKDQTRLIRLLPDLALGGLVQCEVMIVDIDELLEYRAISYEWGPPEPVVDISVNGRRISVRKNLWVFLYLFRVSKENANLLWIDQISINQSDTSERNHQVHRMGDIFAGAMDVVVWLGNAYPPAPEIERVVERHRDCRSLDCDHRNIATDCMHDPCLLCLWRAGCLPADLRRQCYNPRPFAEICDYKDKEILTQTNIFTNSYWTRVWVMQEIILARGICVFLDRGMLSADTLSEFLLCLLDVSEMDEPYYRSVYHIRNALEQSPALTKFQPRYRSLEAVFRMFGMSDLRCTDSRDRVYGFIGMVYAEDSISVDYRLSPSETFAALLEGLIRGFKPILPSNQPHVDHVWDAMLRINLTVLRRQLGVPKRWQRWIPDLNSETYEAFDALEATLDELIRLNFDTARWNGIDLAKILHVVQDLRDRSSKQVEPSKKVIPTPIATSDMSKLVLLLNNVTSSQLDGLLNVVTSFSFTKNYEKSIYERSQAWRDRKLREGNVREVGGE